MLLRLPFLLVCLVGIVVGLVQLNAHRKPAALVLIGSALLGLSSAISLISTVLSIQRVQTGGSHAEFATIVAMLGIAQGLLSAAAFGVLIYAAFAGRKPSPAVTPPAFGASTDD
jgi:hypothetical protein